MGFIQKSYVAWTSVLCWLQFDKPFFKLHVYLLEVVHTSMLADVFQVELASNNSMLLILFVCIFDKTVHIVPFFHGFFASYTKEEHVQIIQFFGYILIFFKGSHRCLSIAVFPRPWHSPHWISFQHELLAVAVVWWTLSREMQFFSLFEGHTAHVGIYKLIEANINKCMTNHCWYLTSSLGSWS
jgi:hypothetical protein